MIQVANTSVLAEPSIGAPVLPNPVLRPEVLKELRSRPQVEMPVDHHFQDGVYLREIFMPANTDVLGYTHKTRHYNIVTEGCALVAMNGGEVREVKAGDVFISEAGVQKWLRILKDMRWITVHANPDNSQDIPKIERRIVEMIPELHEDIGDLSIDQFRMRGTRNQEALQ
jgi:hypothetical protein